MSHLSSRWRRHRGIGLAALLALTMACGSGSGSDDGTGVERDTSPGVTATTAVDSAIVEARRGGKLIYALEGETDSFNSSQGQWNASSWVVASAIFDPLMFYNDDLELVPFLAESFEPNDDHTVWTVTTREGVTFHNGEAFDADALVTNIEAQQASPLVSAALGPVLEVRATGDRTVEFTIAAPWVHFPELFAGQLGMMMAPEMIADDEGGRAPIGTGPFVFREWVLDSRLVVSTNDDYWLARPLLNEIEFRPLPDPTQRINAIRSGDVDVALFNTSPEALAEQPPGTTLIESSVGEDREAFIMFNQLEEPFDDRRVREALVLATDVEQVLEVTVDGYYEPARGIYSPESPWHVATEYPDHDPERARELLDEIEADLGGPLEITLSGPNWPIVLRGGQLLLEQWRAVGIDATLETTELTTFITQVVSGNYDAAFFQWHGAGHPDGEFIFLHSQYAKPINELGLNFSRNVNYTIDEALVEARATEDPDRLRELYGLVQRELAEDLPYLFLWHLKDVLLVSDSIMDLPTWSLPDGDRGAAILQGRQRFHQIWID